MARREFLIELFIGRGRMIGADDGITVFPRLIRAGGMRQAVGEKKRTARREVADDGLFFLARGQGGETECQEAEHGSGHGQREVLRAG